MRTLTVRQPWANLIMFDGKDIESSDGPSLTGGVLLEGCKVRICALSSGYAGLA